MKSQEEAEFIHKLLVSLPATEFLSSLVFWDEKRPITTKILRNLSLKQVAIELDQIERYHEFVDGDSTDERGQLNLRIAEPLASYHARKIS